MHSVYTIAPKYTSHKENCLTYINAEISRVFDRIMLFSYDSEKLK